jgi:DNA polymerase III subunit beta
MLNIKTERNALLGPLQRVVGIVERRHTLPILSNVLVESLPESLTLTTTDLEVQIRTTAHIQASGEAETVSARKLVDILRSLPDAAALTLEGKDGRLQVKAGKTRFSLQTLPAADFPKLADAGESIAALEVKQGAFRQQLENVQFAMAHQDIRYYLNGMLLAVSEGRLVTVATDGHRLSFSSSAIDSGDTKCEVILPRKTVGELIKLLGEGEADRGVRIDLKANQARFEVGETELVSKLIDGKFPDYTKVVPSGYTKRIRLDRVQLLQALNRAAILSNEKIRGVRILLTKDNLNIICTNNEQEEAQEELAIEYASDPIDIGFNVNYLLDLLNHSDAKEIDWSFGDANSSTLLTIPGNEDFKYVVMPMRI